MTSHARIAILTFATLAAIGHAQAQAQTKAPAKKLYCWNENGTRICGDTLPVGAVDLAREEFSARTGARTAAVERALTAEEQAEAALATEQQRASDAAEQIRKRIEQSLLSSYATEDELQHVFNERLMIVQNNIDTAQFNIDSLRETLVTLLQTAAERELSGKPIPPKLDTDIRAHHTQLQQQLKMKDEYTRQSVELSAVMEQTLQRYRELKGLAQPADQSVTP
jgi:HD-GYP domain-containing protein (c-di-GMP phosphodiesterase class II)